MLDVKFEDQQAKDLAVGEYKTFIRDYNLTAAEIFAAYKMALREQLFDENGKRIEIYPNLSLITAGKVLNSYLKFKLEDKAYEMGKAKIKAFLNPPAPEPTAEEKARQRENLKANIRESFKKHGECEFAFLIYEEMKESGAIDKYRSREAVAEIQDRLMRRFLTKELTRNLFYNPTELKQLSDRFYAGEKYKLPELVKQEIKNEILKNYFND